MHKQWGLSTDEGFQAAHHSVCMPLQEGGLAQQDTSGDDLAGHPDVLCKPNKPLLCFLGPCQVNTAGSHSDLYC